MACTVFIDESGDTGIRRVRNDYEPGASPYFVMAAAVIPDATQIVAKSLLSEVRAKIPKKFFHSTDLNHSQTVYFARQAARLNIRCFAVVSRKDTLGDYADGIGWEPHKFYNKCAQYLLEKVGKYLASKGAMYKEPRVVFEARNHDYDAMRRFMQKIKQTPMHPDANYIGIFNPFGFVSKSKAEEPLLVFADLVSHSVYQCVNKTEKNFSIPEPRYFNELSKRFGADERGVILGNGIKCIHNLESLKLDTEIASIWSLARALPLKREETP